ncbi:MAG: response regulator [Acidobacteria bacterium]|nr:response regulator [Acidobacteriota bacterium]
MATILIVDHKINLLRLYQKELKKEGYDVMLASSGEQSLHLLEGNIPDLVILDMVLPGMDGMELIGQLWTRYPRLPIIINTGYRRYKNKSLSECADAYILKSCDLCPLKSAVQSLIKERKAS